MNHVGLFNLALILFVEYCLHVLRKENCSCIHSFSRACAVSREQVLLGVPNARVWHTPRRACLTCPCSMTLNNKHIIQHYRAYDCVKINIHWTHTKREEKEHKRENIVIKTKNRINALRFYARDCRADFWRAIDWKVGDNSSVRQAPPPKRLLGSSCFTGTYRPNENDNVQITANVLLPLQTRNNTTHAGTMWAATFQPCVLDTVRSKLIRGHLIELIELLIQFLCNSRDPWYTDVMRAQ